MDSLDIDQELAKRLFAEGAFLIFLDVPVGTEFGIDLKSWNTGEKFKGVKMIPPGVHIVHYSAVSKHGDIAPKVSFLHNFKKHEILVKKWDIDTEDVCDQTLSGEEIQRFRANLMNLDQFLGTYPLDLWAQWKKLSNHITEDLIKRVTPECGLIRSAVELVSGGPKKAGRKTRGRTSEEKEEDLLPNLVPKSGSCLRLTPLPDAYPEGSTPEEITKHSMDGTYVLDMLTSELENETEILGELQICFICFLIGQSLEALDSWRSLFKVLCNVRIGLTRKRSLYSEFLKVLETQLTFIPEDFLVDIVSSNNVIYTSLRELFRSLEEGSGVEPRLKCEAERLKERLTEKFCWDFEDLEEEIGEDAPVIVDLSNM